MWTDLYKGVLFVLQAAHLMLRSAAERFQSDGPLEWIAHWQQPPTTGAPWRAPESFPALTA